MSEQLDIFDLRRAHEARDEGIRKVTVSNPDFLRAARALAVHIARLRGTVTMDDIRRDLAVEPTHPNAYGVVFRDNAFVWTGQFQPSALVQGHGNLQRVWRLSE